MSSNPPQWKVSTIHVVAGGTAGFLEVLLMHPLDLVKTRLQIQTTPKFKNDPNYYTGILDVFGKLYKQEGVLSFWKGLLPPLIVETPVKSVRFASFDFYRKKFESVREPGILTCVPSGYLAGITESFIICPFEVVKVTQQSERGNFSVVQSAWSKTASIIKEGGIIGKRGIYRGFGATMYRHSFFCAIYLGFFYPIRLQIPYTESTLQDTMVSLALGIATGSCASIINIPFDVVKSRIQAPQSANVEYRSTWQSIQKVVNEEGFLALYKGLLAKVLRLGPGGAIMIIIFETVNDFLSSRLL